MGETVKLLPNLGSNTNRESSSQAFKKENVRISTIAKFVFGVLLLPTLFGAGLGIVLILDGTADLKERHVVHVNSKPQPNQLNTAASDQESESSTDKYLTKFGFVQYTQLSERPEDFHSLDYRTICDVIGTGQGAMGKDTLYDENGFAFWGLENCPNIYVTPVTTQVKELSEASDDDFIPNNALVAYHPENVLGEGGNGKVFLAWLFEQDADDNWTVRDVAFKIGIRPEGLWKSEEKLLQINPERSAFIETPSLAFGYMNAQGYECLVKELAPSDASEYPIDSMQKIAITALTVSIGLYKLHAKRMLHGDLKPENILMSEKGFGKIADFDWAREESDKPFKGGTEGFYSLEEGKQGTKTTLDLPALSVTIDELFQYYCDSVDTEARSEKDLNLMDRMKAIQSELENVRPEERPKAYQIAYRLAELVPDHIRNEIAKTF